MPEHTIPQSLIENIRSGRAALVVGAGVGVPSWKQLLDRMNQRLRARGKAGDEEAAKDVDKLLHKGSLDRAAGFLGRSLGERVCDQIAKETWRTPPELPPIAAALGRLPFRQVWTTFPGDALETAAAAVLPAGWPELRVITYQETDNVNTRRRTLVKVLGDFDSYVVTPKSVRKALTSADSLRDYIKEFYHEGSLVLVGFRYGDPDLAALLDRVFGYFEPPENEHYLIASGVGPVTVDELHAEHHFQTINLAGKGADDTAQAALLEYLEALRLSCDSAGVTLVQHKPEADDLEGWIELLGRDFHDPEAQQALTDIEASASAKGDFDRLIDIYLSKVELEDSADGRAALLRMVADVYESKLGDLPRAFTALTAAVREHPSDTASVDAAERLADAADGWTELVTDVSETIGDIEDKAIAASYWVRVGVWHDKKLRHLDYAVAAFREAIKLQPALGEAYDGLAHVLRKQQRWADLAETLAAHIDIETSESKLVGLYLAGGELYETQLASTQKAIEFYDMAAELDENSDEALCALERIYRRNERWSKLAQVLEMRAIFFTTQGDVARAQAIRTELGNLRAEKLGDLEGSIKKYEIALSKNEHDVEALRALEDLYDKAGRGGDYLRVLGILAEVTEGKAQVVALRKLASEVEKRQSSPEQTVEAYQKLIELSDSPDARKGLARALRQAGRWFELVEALEAQIGEAQAPAHKAEIYVELADIYDAELGDSRKAIDAQRQALDLVPTFGPALAGLAKLYQKTENWDRSLEVLSVYAEQEKSADIWREAGSLAAERSSDPTTAQTYFGRALDLDPGHLPTLVGLAKLYRRAGEHEKAAKQLISAERQSQDRDERVALLSEAADLYRRNVKDADRALRLYRKVLELDNENTNAAEVAVKIYLEENRHAEALPVLEGLVASAADGQARARYMVALGDALLGAGDFDEAAAKYDAASGMDPTLVTAHLGRSRARFEHAKSADDEMLWHEVARLLGVLSNDYADQLDAEQQAEVWRRLGVSHRTLGDLAKAEASLRKALQLVPGEVHALGVLAEVAAQKGDYKTVIEAKREQLKGAKPKRKLELLEQIGDVYVEHLKQPASALGAYKEGIKLDPGAHVLIHKTLEIYTVQKQWPKTIEALAALAET
ncbi:MAG: tetratricopeptide repeat protein, partial [Deltaproteobacteria bacterium]|nr:tetratricopeptide repeat protein [Deltaproteobacteria bacterium]